MAHGFILDKCIGTGQDPENLTLIIKFHIRKKMRHLQKVNFHPTVTFYIEKMRPPPLSQKLTGHSPFFCHQTNEQQRKGCDIIGH